MTPWKWFDRVCCLFGVGFLALTFLHAFAIRYVAGEDVDAAMDLASYSILSMLFWDGFLTAAGVFPLRRLTVSL